MAKVLVRKPHNTVTPERKRLTRPSGYRVTLYEPKRKDGPLKLAHNPVFVEAATEEEAWEKFKKLNNISNSDNERTFEKE